MSRQGSKQNGGAVNTRPSSSRGGPSGSGQRRAGGGGGRGSSHNSAPSKRTQANGKSESGEASQQQAGEDASNQGGPNAQKAAPWGGGGSTFKEKLLAPKIAEPQAKPTDKPKKGEDSASATSAENKAAGIEFGSFGDVIAAEPVKPEGSAPATKPEKLRAERGLQRTTSCPPATPGEGMKTPAYVPDKVITSSNRPHEPSKNQEASTSGKTAAPSNLGRNKPHEPSNLGRSQPHDPNSLGRGQGLDANDTSRAQAAASNANKNLGEPATAPRAPIQDPSNAVKEPAPAKPVEQPPGPKPQDNSSKLPEALPVAVPVKTEPIVRVQEQAPVVKAAAPVSVQQPSMPHTIHTTHIPQQQQHLQQHIPQQPHLPPSQLMPQATQQQHMPQPQIPPQPHMGQHPPQQPPAPGMHAVPGPPGPPQGPPQPLPQHHQQQPQFSNYRTERPERPERGERQDRSDRQDRGGSYHQHSKGASHQYAGRQYGQFPQQQPFRPPASAYPGAFVGAYPIDQYQNMASYVPYGPSFPQYAGNPAYQHSYPPPPSTYILSSTPQYTYAPPTPAPGNVPSFRAPQPANAMPPRESRKPPLKITTPNNEPIVLPIPREKHAGAEAGRLNAPEGSPQPPAPARTHKQGVRIEHQKAPVPGEVPAPPPKPTGEPKHAMHVPPPPPESVGRPRSGAPTSVDPKAAKSSIAIVEAPKKASTGESVIAQPESASDNKSAGLFVSSREVGVLVVEAARKAPEERAPDVPIALHSDAPPPPPPTKPATTAPAVVPATTAATPNVLGGRAAEGPHHGSELKTAGKVAERAASVAEKTGLVTEKTAAMADKAFAAAEKTPHVAEKTAVEKIEVAVAEVAVSSSPVAVISSAVAVKAPQVAPPAPVKESVKTPQSFALDLADDDAEPAEHQEKASGGQTAAAEPKPAVPSVPVAAPAAVPFAAPAAAVPVAATVAAVPGATAASAVPVAAPASAAPVAAPASAAPVAAPASAAPVAAPASAAPVAAPASAVPVAAPASAVPVAAPVSAVPVAAPASAVPIAAPASAVPVAAPASAVPVTAAAAAVTAAAAAAAVPAVIEAAKPSDTLPEASTATASKDRQVSSEKTSAKLEEPATSDSYSVEPAVSTSSEADREAKDDEAADSSADLEEQRNSPEPDGGADSGSQQPAALKKKKKRQDALKRAESGPGKPDMLDVFRIPSKQEELPESTVPLGSSPFAEIAKGPLAKLEKEESEDVSDNWESAVEEEPTSKPKTRAVDFPPGRKIYSRDFLLRVARDCLAIPPGFHDQVPQELVSEGGPPRFESFDRSMPRSRSGQLRNQEEAQWGRRGSMGPGRGAVGPPIGRGPSGQLRPVDSDKWQQRGPPPPPSPGGQRYGMSRSGSSSSNLPALHKTENKYVAGKVITDDPEEEKKQRAFKSVLNKLTLDNFEKLSEQVLDVGISERKTLEGLIDQIFDKALIETNFCEMYASLCQSIHPRLPSFEDPTLPAGKKVDFRRLLLNKCQEEFEKGAAAMRAVEAREAKERDEKEHHEGVKTKEEGEITEEENANKEADKLNAEAERAGRRRMLGNIQFIGHLYRNKLLTEKIMHNCIISLLSEEKNPKAEDVECLCKLMSTVGQQLDSSNKAEHRNAMDVYFARMERVRQNPQLDSRIRFMVQDVEDLRRRKWVPRQKKEGPKKIEDVHREAAQQLEAQAQRDRDERRKGPGGRMDQYGGRSGYGGMQEQQRNERSDQRNRLLAKDEYQTAISAKMSVPQRTNSSDIDLRPQGGRLGFKISTRNDSFTKEKPAAAASSSATATSAPAAAVAAAVAAPPSAPAVTRAPLMDVEESIAAAKGVVEEVTVYLPKGNEYLLNMFKETLERGPIISELVKHIIIGALDHRGKPVEERLVPYQVLFLESLTSEPPLFSQPDFQTGVVEYLTWLQEGAEDNPAAVPVVAKFVGELVAKGLLPLAPICEALLDGEPIEEGGDPPLVEAEHAWAFVSSMMGTLKDLKGETEAASMWKQAQAPIVKFISSLNPDKDSPEKLLEEEGLSCLL